MRATYEELCREAGDDICNDGEEPELIAQVGDMIEELEALIREQKGGALGAPGPDDDTDSSGDDDAQDDQGTESVPEDDGHGEYPERDLWQSWAFLHDRFKKLYDDLLDIDHPLADGLGAILDEIREAEGKTEYRRATRLLTEEATKFIETHDLWDAVAPDDDADDGPNVLPEPTKQMIEKLRTLRRELDRADHEKADEFGKLVDKIPEEVADFAAIMPAARAAEAAWAFADKHKLWEIIAGLPNAEAEALFWKHNGDKYRRLQNLHRSIEDTGQEFAARLGGKLAEIDELIDKDNFYLAGVLVDETWDLAKDNDFIDPDPKDDWESFQSAVENLRELNSAVQVQDGLRDEGFPPAKKLGEYVLAMDLAEANSEWQEALDQYEAGKAYADQNNLWDETGVLPEDDDEDETTDDYEDEYPEKTRWEGYSFFYGNVQKLYDKLTAMDHPLADRLGAYLDEIEEAVGKQEYQRATDLLSEEVKDFTYDNELWDAVKSEDDEEENWIPEETQEQIRKLKTLSRELNRMEHEKAREFERLVDAIPDEVNELSEIIPTGRAITEAQTFADTHDLWAALPPLPKGEEERIFWDTNGPQYRNLNALHRRLEAAGHDKAVRFGEKLGEVDEAIEDDHFHLASIKLTDAEDLADQLGLWDEAPAGDDEDDGEDGWLSRTADFDELRSLVTTLVSQGASGVAELTGTIAEIARAAGTGDFERAEEILDDALERARAAVDDIGSEDEGWLDRRAEFDELQALVERLVSAGAEGVADVTGKVTEIASAVASGDFDSAGEILDDALARAMELAEAAGIDTGGGSETINPATASIKGKVGRGGKNWPADVKTVQLLLNRQGASLEPDSDCGRLTIGAIEDFQNEKFGWKDGRVDPGGATFRALTGATLEDVVDTASDMVRDAAETVVETAEAVVDTVTEAVEDAGEFISGLFDRDENGEDEDEERT